MDLPIKLVIGRMKRLYIKVPWNALSSKPVKLEITGLELVISPLEKDHWLKLVEHQNQFEVLENQIIQHATKLLKEMVEQKKRDSVAKKDD